MFNLLKKSNSEPAFYTQPNCHINVKAEVFLGMLSFDGWPSRSTGNTAVDAWSQRATVKGTEKML